VLVHQESQPLHNQNSKRKHKLKNPKSKTASQTYKKSKINSWQKSKTASQTYKKSGINSWKNCSTDIDKL
jgi:hypothetical protein